MTRLDPPTNQIVASSSPPWLSWLNHSHRRQQLKKVRLTITKGWTVLGGSSCPVSSYLKQYLLPCCPFHFHYCTRYLTSINGRPSRCSLDSSNKLCSKANRVLIFPSKTVPDCISLIFQRCSVPVNELGRVLWSPCLKHFRNRFLAFHTNYFLRKYGKVIPWSFWVFAMTLLKLFCSNYLCVKRKSIIFSGKSTWGCPWLRRQAWNQSWWHHCTARQ